MRKASIAAVTIALAAGGSALFAGTAMAGGCGCEGDSGGHGSVSSSNTGGSGTGGTATNDCLNVGVPILSGLGVAGHGSASGASCDASANGTGGNAS